MLHGESAEYRIEDDCWKHPCGSLISQSADTVDQRHDAEIHATCQHGPKRSQSRPFLVLRLVEFHDEVDGHEDVDDGVEVDAHVNAHATCSDCHVVQQNQSRPS